MNVDVLAVHIGERQVGWIFRYAPEGALPLVRFSPTEDYAALPPLGGPVISASMEADSPDQQRALWADHTSPLFNSVVGNARDVQLPPWWQGLLPEGVFRAHVAADAGCDPQDHFRMLAACGLDLPGNVYCRWAEPTPRQLQMMVTQGQDALEMSVSAHPVEQPAVSISGMQPKVAAVLQGGRYVGRSRDGQGRRFIAKLPTAQYPRLPQLEHLCLGLAAAAGVTTCAAHLAPLSELYAPHRYDLDETTAETPFLAVERFDRLDDGGRIHVETFCQALNVPPDAKYTGGAYLDVAALLMGLPACGEPAVHELLRRIAVDDLLGNTDGHLANIGLIYRDGITAELSPAYDIVGYIAYGVVQAGGHALHFIGAEDTARRRSRGEGLLSPASVRDFCDGLGLNPVAASTALRKCVGAAARAWPALIAAADLTDRQKARLRGCIAGRPIMQSVLRRDKTAAALWPEFGAGTASDASRPAQ